MTEDNQNNEFKPQPLPGQVFIRPGIDDRPDYEKTLTPEAKAAMRRLSVQQHPRIPEASNERPETQAARIASEGGAPLTAAAHLDVAVPNLESSFLDLRDPMTAPDGTRPTAMQANRLVAGFALGSMLLSAPMAAFNTVLIPQTVSRLSGINRVTDLAMLVIAGAIMTFLLNACIAVGSDHSYCRFGRRTHGSSAAAYWRLSAWRFFPHVIFSRGPCSSGWPRRPRMRWRPYRSPPRSANVCLTSSVTAPIRGTARGWRLASWSASPWLLR